MNKMLLNLRQKKKMVRVCLGTVSILVLLTLFFVTRMLASDAYKIQKLIKEDIEVNNVFMSKRGFGNDRFDIYRFTLKNPKTIDALIAIDDEGVNKIHRMAQILESEMANDEIGQLEGEEILKDLSQIQGAGDGQYLYLKIGEYNSEIFVYSKRLNKGYYFINVI